jgi:tol-pal system protein YbgF
VTSRVSLVIAACLAASALAGCASTPPEEDAVQIKLNDLETRLTKVERVIANQSLLDLANQLETLRADVRAIHNDVDVLNHNLDTARKQQRDLYADLDRRLKALEGRGGGPSPSGTAAAPAGNTGASGAQPPQDATEKTSYQAAFELLKDSRYDQAIAAFQNFLASYPTSQLADNAQYWLGEAYYVNKSFAEALAAFQRVVDNFPGSRKLPDALLKIGYCDYELKQLSEAHEVLSRVATTYPDSPAGHLAQQRLEKMAAEHH